MSFHSPNTTAPSTTPAASTETDSASAPLLWNVDPLGMVGPPCAVLENGATTVAEARELETATEEVAFTAADELTVSVVADTFAIAGEACMCIRVSMPSPVHWRIASREERRRTELRCAEPDKKPDREPLVADSPAETDPAGRPELTAAVPETADPERVTTDAVPGFSELVVESPVEDFFEDDVVPFALGTGDAVVG